MQGRIREVRGVAVLAAVLGAMAFLPQVAGAKKSKAKVAATEASIEAEADGARIVDADSMRKRAAGYYRITGSEGPARAAFWTPRRHADDAPPAIKATPAYKASRRAGAHAIAGAAIYGPEASVVYYPSNLPGARVSGLGQCPNSWFCLWRNSGFSGSMLQFKNCCNWQNLTAYNFNDKVSSLANRKSNHAAKVAKHTNGNGSQLCFTPFATRNSLSGGWNDSLSSIKIKSGTGC